MLDTWKLEPSIVLPFEGGSDHSNLVTGIVTRVTGDTNWEARYQFDVPAIGLVEAEVDGPYSSISMNRRAMEMYATHTIRSLAIQIGPYFDANTEIEDYDQSVLPSALSPTFRAFHDQVLDVCVTELGYEKAMEVAREALEWNDTFDPKLPGLGDEIEDEEDFTNEKSMVREVFGELQGVSRVCREYDDMIEYVQDFVDDPVAVIRAAEHTPERTPPIPATAPRPGL
jgi:hypothetical protein